MENVLLRAVPVLLALLRQAINFVNVERARTGKTSDEIFADAGARLEANDAALVNDLLIYAPSGDSSDEASNADTK